MKKKKKKQQKTENNMEGKIEYLTKKILQICLNQIELVIKTMPSIPQHNNKVKWRKYNNNEGETDKQK